MQNAWAHWRGRGPLCPATEQFLTGLARSGWAGLVLNSRRVNSVSCLATALPAQPRLAAPGQSPAAGAGAAQPAWKSRQLPEFPYPIGPGPWECGPALPDPGLARGLEFLTLLGLLLFFFFSFA